MRAPRSPMMQEILDTLAEFDAPPLETLSPDQARNLPTFADAVASVVGKHFFKRAMPHPEPVARISHKRIPTPDGELLARAYYPKEVAISAKSEPKESLPILVYFHGGGWVLADLNAYDASCRALCNESGFIVVSVAYRRAPEHPYPAAIDDAYAAYRWIRENPEAFGGATDRIAIGGESAGGNLAAVACLRAKLDGVPLPIHQLLVYPVTDLTFSGRSHLEHANAKPLDAAMMTWFKRHYLGGRADPVDPYVSPIFSRELADLPSATIITAELDPLCSDGEAYAKRLELARVPVAHHRFDGVTHEFFGAKAVLPEAREAIRYAGDALRFALRDDDEPRSGLGAQLERISPRMPPTIEPQTFSV